jgi:hypothetical protein
MDAIMKHLLPIVLAFLLFVSSTLLSSCSDRDRIIYPPSNTECNGFFNICSS